MTQSEAARIFVDETVPTLEESIDKFAATANRIADELIAASALNRQLTAALERATAIMKAWAGNDIVSDDTLMEMTDEVIPLCDAALATAKGGEL